MNLLAPYLTVTMTGMMVALLMPPDNAGSWTKKKRVRWVLTWWVAAALWPIVLAAMTVVLVFALLSAAREGWTR